MILRPQSFLSHHQNMNKIHRIRAASASLKKKEQILLILKLLGRLELAWQNENTRFQCWLA